MKSQAQLEASIDRFQQGFWRREQVDRPPVGITADRTWLPINYLRKPFPRNQILPEDITPSLVRSDYEDSFADRAVLSDDLMPYSAAWRGIPWLSAICGCEVRYSTGSLAAEACVASAEELAATYIPARQDWLHRLHTLTRELTATAAPDCWISTTILRGASDVLAAMRGLTNFFLDVHDHPQILRQAAARVNQVHLDILTDHFSLVQPKLGGYGHIFGYWAPGPTTVIQEDAMGLCAPTVYRDLFMETNAQIIEHLGDYVFFHLHATGYQHTPHVLDLPGLAGMQITVESNGPDLVQLLPTFRQVLAKTRLIIFVDSHFGKIYEILPQLPRDGLYLMISDKFIDSEKAFRRFVETGW